MYVRPGIDDRGGRLRPFGLGALLALLAVVLVPAAPGLAQTGAQSGSETPSAEQQMEELRRELEALRAEMREMREEREAESDEEMDVEETADSGRLDELERRIDVLASELEQIELGEAAVRADESEYGFGPAASKIYRTGDGLSIGGYGEMLYEAPDSTRDDGSPSGGTDELDFLRGILYFGYKFNDRFLFNSEIEFEHASTGADGEASVEFAYLDYLWRPEANVRAGLLLVPMGFVNELHEPTVFLGARRPDVERVIIPTTWRENGFGLFGEVGPVSYRTYIVNGLEGAGFSAGGLRGGRQKGSHALAEDFAWVGRVDYAPMPGLQIGASAYVGDSGQDLVDAGGQELELGTTILEGHAEWRWRGLELRALYAQAELDDVARFNQAFDLPVRGGLGEELTGGYFQAGYDVLAPVSSTRQLIPYVRYEEYDTQAKTPRGYESDPARDVESLTLGLAFKPIDQIILKADWQDYDNGAGTATDQLNVALGYIF